MKLLLQYWLRCLPFTIGIVLVLLALCFLVEFYEHGLDDYEEFWAFAIFIFSGMPLLLFGIEKLGKQPE